MLIKEVLQRRDELKRYLYTLSIVQNYCDKNIGDKDITSDLKSIHKEFSYELEKISESLKPFEEMDM